MWRSGEPPVPEPGRPPRGVRTGERPPHRRRNGPRKPVLIGEIQDDGQFSVVWKTEGTVPGDAWSDYLPGSKDIEADWVKLKCGNYNTKTKKCSGQNY